MVALGLVSAGATAFLLLLVEVPLDVRLEAIEPDGRGPDQVEQWRARRPDAAPCHLSPRASGIPLSSEAAVVVCSLPCLRVPPGEQARGGARRGRARRRGVHGGRLGPAEDKYQVGLLVVGNCGLNTLAGRLLGSVPADVSRRAPCDVLIVHTVQ